MQPHFANARHLGNLIQKIIGSWSQLGTPNEYLVAHNHEFDWSADVMIIFFPFGLDFLHLFFDFLHPINILVLFAFTSWRQMRSLGHFPHLWRYSVVLASFNGGRNIHGVDVVIFNHFIMNAFIALGVN